MESAGSVFEEAGYFGSALHASALLGFVFLRGVPTAGADPLRKCRFAPHRLTK